MSASADGPRLCRLEQAVGVDTPCPEDSCAFWEPGGAVLQGRCAVEGVDFGRDCDLALWLLAIRDRLAAHAPPAAREDGGHEFRRSLSKSTE
jgi:hypothetical protein